jgi:predicted N-acyltransferase
VAALPVLLNTDAWIAVPPGGWPDWVAALPSKGRRDSVKQEVRAFARAGYELRVVPLAESYREAAGLLTAVQRRHGRPHDVGVLAESLRRQSVAMKPLGEVLLCARPGEAAVAFCLFYVLGDTLYVRAAGLDYDRLSGAAEYFNLVYYEMVRVAGQRSLRWIHPGIASGDAKALRGARLRPTWLLDLSPDSALVGRDADVRAANAARIGELTATPATAKAFDADAARPFA